MNEAGVEAAGVWKFFGDYPALREIELSIPSGSCVALIGRNGAGKTTLLRILGGLSRAAKGTVTVGGTDPREAAARRRIGFIGHGISVYDDLSAIENLNLFARLYGLPQPSQAAQHWLERVGLARVKDGLVREFSRGMRQRLAVARAFVHDPAVLLLDEPFTSLDDRAIALLQKLIHEARAEGRSVIMSTHQLREALELASDVALLERGRLLHYGARTAEMAADPSWLYRRYGERD
ncbi:MAG: heme ABC exporter ATP-binding protein CcmA [Bryobacteraceae bacterium]